MRIIIGLTGYSGSGKDEAANGLVEHLKFQKLSLAQPLKDAVYKLNPIVAYEPSQQGYRRVADLVESYGWDTAKRMYPELRELLQRMGTDVGRNMFGSSFWIDQFIKKVEAIEPWTPIVVADVRFRNEAHLIHTMGGQVLRIQRPGVEAVNNHISDSGINDLPIDGVITNGRSIEELHAEIVMKVKNFIADPPQQHFRFMDEKADLHTPPCSLDQEGCKCL